MKLSQFKFSISDNLLATHPSQNRDESRLMVVHRDTGEIEHKVFKDILDYFDEGDVLILNNTKVFCLSYSIFNIIKETRFIILPEPYKK